MIKPMIKIHNVATGAIIEREMNDEEFAQLQIDIADEAAKKLETETKVEAKSALLEKLGITEAEAKLLLG